MKLIKSANEKEIQITEDYLSVSTSVFWNVIKSAIEYRPSISGYSTTYNCVSQEYPFVQSILSMLGFCDEVCVVDGGSTDGTLEKLHELAKNDKRIIVKSVPRDWSSKNSPVFDGQQKAAARAMCSKEFCWQMDTDEVVHEDDYSKVFDMCRAMPKGVDVLALPVIEYWGGPSKVRMDIQPWKWRLSRNNPNITHGIPKELQLRDENNEMYAAPGTDGCDMIDRISSERLPHISFYTEEIENIRRIALIGDEQSKKKYETWFNYATNSLPCVFHYSWYNLERKIKLYKNFWTRHWIHLYGQTFVDSAEQNMMFDCPWSEVTDEMIKDKAKLLASKTGGHIWHQKWDGSTVPHIQSTRTQPAYMLESHQ